LNTNSASVNISISNLNQSSASQQVSINSLNQFTASQSTASIVNSITALNTFSASTLVSLANINSTTESLNNSVSLLNASSASQQISINNLNTATQSLFLSASLAIVTASVVDDDITFRKGDGTTFTIQVATGSFALSASYAATASEARNVVVIARNGGTSTLPAGTVVHITSAVGDNPVFTTASYDTEALSSNTFGLLRYSSPSGADVEVVVNGIVTGVNTDPALGYAAGDIVYLSSSGQFTRVQPQAPNQIVTLGQVLRAQQNQGSIYVSINNGWEIDELHNVQINSPQTGDLLQYESASYGLWKNKSISGAGITTTSSFNAYTSSTNIRLNNLEAATSSYAISSSVAAVDFAQQQQIDALIAFTGSVTASTQIQSSGTILGQVTSLNFVGTGVNVSVGASTASITINAGSGSGGGTAGNSYTSTFQGTTWVVNHNLNTSVPLVFAYESGSQWVIPASLDVTSPNTVTLQFSSNVSGSIVVVNGGDQTVIETITNATTAVLTHNLNTEWPMVQVYESSSRAQIIPLSVVSDNVNQITIGFSTPVSGKVVIKK
jgi:hypothetical protein